MTKLQYYVGLGLLFSLVIGVLLLKVKDRSECESRGGFFDSKEWACLDIKLK